MFFRKFTMMRFASMLEGKYMDLQPPPEGDNNVYF